MKVGDRVRVIDMDCLDKNTYLSVGEEGVIVNVCFNENGYEVIFDNASELNLGDYWEGYYMFSNQLELISVVQDEFPNVTQHSKNNELLIGELRNIFEECRRRGFTENQSMDVLLNFIPYMSK